MCHTGHKICFSIENFEWFSDFVSYTRIYAIRLIRPRRPLTPRRLGRPDAQIQIYSASSFFFQILTTVCSE